MTATTFQVPSANSTTYHADPKIAAYKYAAWVHMVLNRNFLMTVEDGVYTVEVMGLEVCRFARAEAR